MENKNINKRTAVVVPKVETKNIFDEKLVKEYPKSNRKIPLEISAYSIDGKKLTKCYTTHLSPYGIEFSSPFDYLQGTLLRINVSLPDYWQRKRRLVDYHRVEPPEHFRILARVVKSDTQCKKSKKILVLAQTVNMDKIDKCVLTSYLQEE